MSVEILFKLAVKKIQNGGNIFFPPQKVNLNILKINEL